MHINRLFLIAVISSFLIGCSAPTPLVSSESGFTSKQSLFHDWGDMNIRGGTASHLFVLENTSSEPILLTGAVTSCMCTTAQITLKDGTVSPVFGMQNNDGWSYQVSPQETFEVNVTFDPLAHGPNAVGVIRRTVNVISDPDPNVQGVIYTRLDVQGNVLSEIDYQQQHG